MPNTNPNRDIIVIVGGGAAGLTAAISAARAKPQAQIIIFDHLPKFGKKILASGAGRCNLMNERLDSSFYNEEAREIVASIFHQFGKEAVLRFFRELGLFTYAESDGRIFPRTNHALTLMELLDAELDRLGIQRVVNTAVKTVHPKAGRFELMLSTGKKHFASKLILCTGGKSYPALGSDGSGFEIASSLGHKIIEPVPATVPLLARDPWCHPLQGVKIRGRACAAINGKINEWVEGDILFTHYGLSGTAVLDISDPVSIAIHRNHSKNVRVLLDFVPFLDEPALVSELKRRQDLSKKNGHFLAGLVHPKLEAIIDNSPAVKNIPELCRTLKQKSFTVTGTRGWNEAEFTAGGVSCREVDPKTLESKKHKGLYFAGEILDVNGRRGGYQLAFAWASGYLAGLAAANNS